jgi:hypothetical protein
MNIANILSTAGQNLMLRAEGNQQLASALAEGVRTLTRRLARRFGVALRSAHGARPRPR